MSTIQKMSRKKLAIAGVALVAVIVLASMLGYNYYQQQLVQSQKVEEQRSTLYVGTNNVVRFLDGTGYAAIEELIQLQIYDQLLGYDPKTAQIVPAMAESLPTISSDGLTYTVHIRKGVTWHDGTPLVAQQILDSYQRITRDPNALGNDVVFAAFNLNSTKVIDQYTLEFHLRKPFSLALHLMATPLTMIAKPGPTLDEMRNKDLYVGTGPWKFDHWTRLNEIVLTRNDNYWDKTRIPKLKTLVFKLYSDVSTEVLDLKAHTIDAAWPSFLASDIQDFKTDSRFNVQPEVTGRLAILEFSVKTEPLNDSRVRQAFAYAIDRSEIVSRVYKGINAKDALSLVPDVFPGYSPAFQKYSYDPDKAKQLLAAAGYPNGIDITLTFSTRDPGDSDLAVVLQSETAKAGIRLNLKQMEHSAFQALHTKGDFQGALILHWSYDYYAGVQYLMTFLANPDLGGYEAWMSGYKNTQVDNLVSTYLASTDESQTLQIGTQLQDIAAQDVPVLPLVSSLEYWISWNTVNGLTPGNPFFSTDFSVITKTA